MKDHVMRISAALVTLSACALCALWQPATNAAPAKAAGDLEIQQTVTTAHTREGLKEADAAQLKQILQLSGSQGRSVAWRVKPGESKVLAT